MRTSENSVVRLFSFRGASLTALLCCIFPLTQANAASPRLSQMGHTSWRLEDGVFPGTPTTIAQTTDGYLWIGTTGGLSRFDGVRFMQWNASPGASLANANVGSLLGSRDGRLWIGTAEGIYQLQNGRVTKIPKITGGIYEIAEDSKGSIWLAQIARAMPLCSISNSQVRCFGKQDGFTYEASSFVAAARDDSIWIDHGSGISVLTAGGLRTFTVKSLERAQGLEGKSILPLANGCAIVGFMRSGEGAGLEEFCNGKWKPYTLNGHGGTAFQVTSLYRGRDGTLWVGTVSDGLYRFQNGSVDHMRRMDGLSGDCVQRIFEDREGTIWVVTTQGLDRLRTLKVITYSKTEGLNSDLVGSVLAGSDGTIWIGNEGSLDVIARGVVSSIRGENGLPGLRVTSLFQDERGTLWVGVDNQLYIYKDRRFLKIETPGTALMGIVQSLAEDKTHDIWAAAAAPNSVRSLSVVVRIRGNKVIERYPVPNVYSVAPDAAGGVYIASRGGLAHLQNGTMVRLDDRSAGAPRWNKLHLDRNGVLWGPSVGGLIARKDGIDKIFGMDAGLPCAKVNAIVEARDGDFWLSQPCGYTHIPYQQIQSALRGDRAKWHVEVLDSLDGAKPGFSPFSPDKSLALDGTIWFATQTSLQEIDTEHLHANVLAPPVHIEGIVADHKTYDPNDNLKLPAHTRDLEIDFTALSLAVPQKVQFRYMLDGWDTGWQNPANRRQAFYTNLGPGPYVFHVMASNEDGVWNEQGSTLGFAIAPAFYQTRWFAVLSVLCLLAILYLTYLFRMRQITSQIKHRFLERMTERERIARDLHDSFFQGIQGLLLHFNTATAQLKPGEPTKAIFVEALRKSDQVMLEGRELVLDLRASSRDKSDLPSSIAQLGEDFGRSFPSAFTIVVTGQTQPLHSVCSEELYWIGREAIYNAFRHAHAEKIEAELDYACADLTLVIRDDGRGIDEKILQDGAREGHLGLPGMQERAKKIGARIMVSSRKNGGTEVEISVPAAIAYSEFKPRGSLTRLKAILARWQSSAEGSHG